ncbi:hypothetical protein LTR78_006161 [Recurvomyces mirabilis]|uniref:Uncharacterized protein n=1 Tax=Recurvomyces mirabilis TaxID=574656 RepID=A0AAE1C0I3_9PEZI|nr:hypothetical protein LTR78_006161 [Recurvomyces mirabilis]KAK5152003.1 hypothetical protein LTS14_008777 [Recurvomyces mirabilis]
MAYWMIQAYNIPKESRGPGGIPACATVTDAEEAMIKDTMLQKLKNEAIAAGWNPGTVVKNSVILTMEYEVQKITGWYVVKAVKDFLQLDPAVQADTNYQGLVVDYAHGNIQKLRNKWQPIEKAMLRQDELGDWHIRV